jgi:hypothetical protein
MIKIRENIKSLYAINLVEGEGVGTAYEYYAKLRKLEKFINSMEKPKKILIAGLPEKYGLSMDFFLLGQMLNTETVVVDERSEVLERAQNTLHHLNSIQRFDDKKVLFIKAEQMAEFKNESLLEEEFDLALSSEVFQRLDGGKETYLSNLKRLAKNFALFAPNSGNSSHAKLSGLKSIHLEELLKLCEGYSELSIYDCGYLDMPPFPPGFSRSQEKRQRASESRLEAFLMKGLEFYCHFEDFIPKPAKERIAHITYLMGKSH